MKSAHVLAMQLLLCACSGSQLSGVGGSSAPEEEKDSETEPTSKTSKGTPDGGDEELPGEIPTDPESGDQSTAGDGSGEKKTEEVGESESSELVCAARSYRVQGQCVAAVPMYHWKNELTSKHLYTLTATQACESANPATDPVAGCQGEAVQGGGWRYVGIEFYTTPNDTARVAGLAEFFRLYKHSGPGHFFTSSSAERDSKLAEGFNLELTHQIFVTKEPHTVPLNRWRHNSLDIYLYSVSAGNGATMDGWTFDAVAGFVFK